MTNVSVARIERRIPPGPLPIGFPAHVIMLADDAGRRVLPIWGEFSPRRFPQLFGLSGTGDEAAGTAEARTVDELTARLLRAAGARVTGVDIDELGPEVPAARINLATAAGTRPVTARVVEGLAVAITAGAPIRVAEPVMDRLAVPLPDDDQPVSLPEPAAALAALSNTNRPRYEPRNLAFAYGLDGWSLGGSFTGHASDSHWQDYSCTAEDGSAALSAAVPQPAGYAFLAQEMFADDYRGAVVTFRGEFRARDHSGPGAGLFLRAVRGQDVRQSLTERAAVDDPDNTIVTIAGHRGWTSHQVTARVPEDSNTLLFGVFLSGRGRIEMRHAELVRDA